MKVALVHDWLTGMRGGEKCLDVLCELFPEADLYTLLHIRGTVSPIIERMRIVTSPLQYLPGIARHYRNWLPLMPRLIERFAMNDYDLIVSSSHCVAKGVIPGAHTYHVGYCHTPMRYIWDQYEEYFGRGRGNPISRALMARLAPWLRTWDRETSTRVHQFIANSEHVRQRIRRFYGREARVIYPPVDTAFFTPNGPASQGAHHREGFFLMVTALAPYKRVDVAIEAFNRLRDPLLIIGTGQEERRLRRLAGPTVKFLGWLGDESLRWYYQRCRALIFPGEEDFGIAPLEAQAAGRPVIAYARGGALETVIEGETGTFFHQQMADHLVDAVQRFERMTFDPVRVRQHALRFDRAVFKQKIGSVLQDFHERERRSG
ncbi:MAG: glycosyltransferase [Elusimicrobia bacterium]|nr:glycosyltransferase [Elusimicrobiota bacterium]